MKIQEINSSLPKNPSMAQRIILFQASKIVLCMHVVWDHITKGTAWIKRTKPHIENHIVREQNNIWVAGLCRFVSEEFNDND